MTARLTLGYWGSSTLEIGLEVDDAGQARSWQTGGARAGRFARPLTDAEHSEIDQALRVGLQVAAEGGDVAPTGEVTSAPSGAAEQLVADGLLVTFDPMTGPPRYLAPLVTIMTAIRSDLAGFPVAAVELAVSGTTGVWLRHIGSEPIRLRTLEAIGVDVTTYDQDSGVVDTSSHVVEMPAPSGAVEQGWELQLLDRVGATVPTGGWMTVSITSLELDVLGDGVLRQADLSWASS